MHNFKVQIFKPYTPPYFIFFFANWTSDLFYNGKHNSFNKASNSSYFVPVFTNKRFLLTINVSYDVLIPLDSFDHNAQLMPSQKDF